MKTFSTGTMTKTTRPKGEEDPTAIALLPKIIEEGGRSWSPQQTAIFAACGTGANNLLVRARAGTGKTTTIIEACKHLNGKVLLCAFNKRVAEELAQRAPSNVHVRTLHGLGFALVRRWRPNIRVDDKRGLTLATVAAKGMGVSSSKNEMWAAKTLASLGKETMPFNSAADSLQAMGLAFGVFDGLPPISHTRITRVALASMKLAQEDDGTLDYSDMLYLPLMKKLTKGEYDCVIVDEAQDMNFSQLELALQVVKKDGRVIVVGDDRQAIYGFRGADSSSLDRLKKRLKATELGLTITYRCPAKVVAIAKLFVPDFQAAPTAPEGVVTQAAGSQVVSLPQAGDFVLSRVNAPLLRVCLGLIKVGKKARVEGKDIGRALSSLVYKLKVWTIPDLRTAAMEWSATAIACAGDDEERISQISDQVDALMVLSEDAASTQELLTKIETLFEDTGGRRDTIVCSTVHKAKGLEADRVFILCSTFRGDWKGGTGEEANLKYVAVTRSKRELVWVDSMKEVMP